MVSNRADKETYLFLIQPLKGEAGENPFQEVLPQLATLRKKIQRDLLKFLHVRWRYLLQKLQGRSTPRDLSVCKSCFSRAQWGLYHCNCFGFFKETYKRRNCLQVSLFFRTPHFRKIVGSHVSSTATRQLPNPLLQTALHST